MKLAKECSNGLRHGPGPGLSEESGLWDISHRVGSSVMVHVRSIVAETP